MPIAIDFTTTYNTENTGTYYTAQHACSGVERGLLVFVSNTSQANPHAIRFNNIGMTKELSAIETNTGKQVSIWSLINPPAGTFKVAVSYSVAVAACFTIISMTGVNQTDMVSNTTASVGLSTNPTLGIASNTTEVVFDVIAYDTTTASVGGNQIQMAQHRNPSMACGTSRESGSSTVTMNWTLAASEEWAIGAVSVVPASISTQPSTSSSISIDAISVAQTDNTGTTYTHSHTSSGSNRGVLVTIACTSTANPHGVRYGGLAMKEEGFTREVPTGRITQIWSLVGQSTGAQTVTVSLSAAVAMAMTVISLNNVDQVDLCGGYAGAAASNTSPTLNISAAAGELIIDSLSIDVTDASPSSGNQTLRNVHGNIYAVNGTSTKPSTGLTTMSWSLIAPDDWALGAVNVKPFVSKVGKSPPATLRMSFADPRTDYDFYTIIQNPMPADVSAGASAGPSLPGNTGSVGGRVSLPPQSLENEEQWRRQAQAWMVEANQGRINNTGIVTLQANAASTTVRDERVGVDSFIGLMPRTANASIEQGNGTLYVVTGKQTFTIAHSNNAQTDRVFVYSILG